MTSNSANESASVVTHYQLNPGVDSEFATAQVEVSRALASHAHYVGAEIYTGASDSQQTVVRRFTSAQAARDWLASPARTSFEQNLNALCSKESISNILLSGMASDSAAATAVITTRVKDGDDAWFADWQGRIGAAQQQFPGYVGQRVQAPIPGVNSDWVSIVAFDTAEDLKAWNDSETRKSLVAESTPHVERYDVRSANSAFESWFANSTGDAKPPPAWKLSAIVLLVLYPVVMLEMFTLNKLTASLHIETAAAIFIGNLVSVAITGFLLIPWASKALNWWLVPPESVARRRTLMGSLLIVLLYAVCILIFALLLSWDPQLM